MKYFSLLAACAFFGAQNMLCMDPYDFDDGDMVVAPGSDDEGVGEMHVRVVSTRAQDEAAGHKATFRGLMALRVKAVELALQNTIEGITVPPNLRHIPFTEPSMWQTERGMFLFTAKGVPVGCAMPQGGFNIYSRVELDKIDERQGRALLAELCESVELEDPLGPIVDAERNRTAKGYQPPNFGLEDDLSQFKWPHEIHVVLSINGRPVPHGECHRRDLWRRTSEADAQWMALANHCGYVVTDCRTMPSSVKNTSRPAHV